MKIQTLALIYKLLQDEAAQADRECTKALALRRTIEAGGDTLTELQKRRLNTCRERVVEATDALNDFESQGWGS